MLIDVNLYFSRQIIPEKVLTMFYFPAHTFLLYKP